MNNGRYKGAVNPALLVLFAGALILAAILLGNAYRYFVPAALTVNKTEVVEALEVMDRVSPLRKNGLELSQNESLRGGGSSRLVVTRPAANGAFLLVAGQVSHSFLAEKLELDRMLHFSVNASEITVTSDGEPVRAIPLLPRFETAPLRVDALSPGPDVDIVDTLFANQTLQPVPAGTKTGGKFVSANGMSVDAGFGMGRSGTMNLGGDSLELTFALDEDSSAWAEMPKTVRVQHSAVGADDLNVAVLIPRDASGTGPFKVFVLGEEVASISRR